MSRELCRCAGTGVIDGRFCRRRGCVAGRDLEARIRTTARDQRSDRMSRDLRSTDEHALDRYADDGGRMYE